MKIILNLQKLTITDKLKAKIESKFERGLGVLMQNWQEDLKVANLSIEKVARSGYIIKFDLNLPGAAVNVQDTHKVLIDGIVRVKNQAKRQLKKRLEILRGR